MSVNNFDLVKLICTTLLIDILTQKHNLLSFVFLAAY